MTTNANDNEVRVLWSDIQCEYLIDQRISRNRYFFSYFTQNYFICYNKNGFFTKFLGSFGRYCYEDKYAFGEVLQIILMIVLRQVLARSRLEQHYTITSCKYILR